MINFREFSNVFEIHYFLLGYQSSESDNLTREGHGKWISRFMLFCDRRLTEAIAEQKLDDCGSLEGNYCQYIYRNQRNDNDGMRRFYELLDDFLKGVHGEGRSNP